MRLDEDSGVVVATSSGYLQFVRLDKLVAISSASHAVIRLLHRPGHFVVAGEPLAQVWPAAAAPGVARALGGAHATGPHRTLTQDLSFAVDQLVEIAIRALSPAVNDTFTALACIDWLGDGLCKIAERWHPVSVHRDTSRPRTRNRGHHRVPAPGRARARQDPPGQPSNAGRDDPPTRRHSQSDRSHQLAGAARGAARAGGHDPPRERGISTRGGRPRGRTQSLRPRPSRERHGRCQR